jgi:hypothetical protein
MTTALIVSTFEQSGLLLSKNVKHPRKAAISMELNLITRFHARLRANAVPELAESLPRSHISKASHIDRG